MFLNLIWDFDGTLFDTYPAIANSLRAAVGDLAVPPSFEEVRDMALISIDGCLKTMSTTYDLPLEELEAGFERHYRDVTADDQPPFDGVREVCELICASGGLNLIVTHRRRSGMDRLLAAHGLADLIADTVSCYDDGYPRKPDPAAFLMLIERHHLRLDQTLAIGDRDTRRPRRSRGRPARGTVRPDSHGPHCRFRPGGLRCAASNRRAPADLERRAFDGPGCESGGVRKER